MRILAISAYYPPDVVGGYEWAAYEVLRRLRERGHAVRVLCGAPGAPCPSAPEVVRTLRRVRADDDTLSQKLSVFRAYLHNYHTIRRQIETFRPDVVYYWAGGALTPAILAAGETSGCPLVLHLEDYWVPQMMAQRGGTSLVARASQALRKTFASLPTYPLERWGWIFVSQSLRDEYAVQGINVSQGIVVPNALDALPPEKEWPASVPSVLRVGYCGRLHPNKGVEQLLQAAGLAQLTTGAFELCLWGAGGAAYEATLQAMAHELCPQVTVRWMGSVARDQMPAAYRSLDLLVVPSQWDEPFGLVAIEAMGAGVPVLATRSGALPQIVTDACGWGVEKTPAALAEGLSTALADYATLQRLGKAGRARVESTYLWGHNLETIDAYLQSRVNGD